MDDGYSDIPARSIRRSATRDAQRLRELDGGMAVVQQQITAACCISARLRDERVLLLRGRTEAELETEAAEERRV